MNARIRKIALLAVLAIAMLISACGRLEVTGGNNGCGNLACTNQPTPISIQYVP